MSFSFNPRHNGLAGNLILTFVAIFTLTISLLGTIFVRSQEAALSESLKKRAETLVRNLAVSLSDPYSMGEYDQLQNIIEAAKKTDSEVADILVVGTDGLVVASTDATIRNNRLADKKLETDLLKINNFSSRDTIGGTYQVMMPVNFLNQKLGALKVGMSTSHVEALVWNTRKTTVSIGLLVLFAGLAIYVYLARLVTRPVNQVIELAQKIAGGDLSLQNLESSMTESKNEVGILTRAFSQMSENLKDVIRHIQETAHQITSMSDQLFASIQKVSDGAVQQVKATNDTSSSIDRMNTSVAEISGSIDAQSILAQSAAASLEEMSAAIILVASNAVSLTSCVEDTTSSLLRMSETIKRVVHNVEMLSEYSENTTVSINDINASIMTVGENAGASAALTEQVSKDAAELGIVAIGKVIDAMDRIEKTVEKSSKVIHRLGERSEHIGNILNVIDDIARQTNLLALNASILAAQAGEHGRGFAVVADEVKNLSDRTTASTKEIAELIRDVQDETTEAVTAIGEGAVSVQEGVQLSIETRESLNNILESSKRSSEMSHEIEQATLKQVQATGHVTQLMEQVNSMVQQISSSIKELEKGTMDITGSSRRMKSITLQVRNSTEEQAKGSRLIRDSVDDNAVRIQLIANAMNAQKQSNEVISMSIGDIIRIANVSKEMVQQMDQAVAGLVNQARILEQEVYRFKV